MIKSFSLLAFMAALGTSAMADPSLPENVVVATDEIAAKEFTAWIEKDVSKYDGTYSGEVGGDGMGKLVIKVAKGADGPSLASGTFTHTFVGLKPIVVKITNAVGFGDPDNVFTASAFNVVFVKYGKTPGVVVGKVFIPRE